MSKLNNPLRETDENRVLLLIADSIYGPPSLENNSVEVLI